VNQIQNVRMSLRRLKYILKLKWVKDFTDEIKYLYYNFYFIFIKNNMTLTRE